MKQLLIPKLAAYDVTIWQLENGVIAEFPTIKNKKPMLASFDDGRTWTVCSQDLAGKTVWKTEKSTQGLVLDSEITRMYKECKFGNPAEAIEVAHIMMVRSLTGR